MSPSESLNERVGLVAGTGAEVKIESYDEAFWRLVHLAHHRAYRILGVAADAEDVAAETLARASLRWNRLNHPVDAWVGTVATRLAIDRQRKAWRTLPLPDGNLDDSALVQAMIGTGNGERVDVAQRIDLARALSRLPKRQRQVLGLAYLSGYTEAEIADLLACSASSVQTHKRRGLERVRALLGTAPLAVSPTRPAAIESDEEVEP